MIHLGTRFLSICGPGKRENKLRVPKNTVVGEAKYDCHRHSHSKKEKMQGISV